jgi:hypothetical protein
MGYAPARRKNGELIFLFPGLVPGGETGSDMLTGVPAVIDEQFRAMSPKGRPHMGLAQLLDRDTSLIDGGSGGAISPLNSVNVNRCSATRTPDPRIGGSRGQARIGARGKRRG